MKSFDQFGYYRVGDLKFYSKLEAIECMKKTNIHLHWDFNEAVFSSYDWTQEPEEDILELYRQRAQQLREKYDYIVLMYSGGSDSQNILDSFVENNIQLDEIASLSNYDQTGDSTHFLNSELFNVSIPKGKQLLEKCPWMKHTIVDVSKLTIDYFRDAATRFDWIYNLNMFFTPAQAGVDNLPRKIPEWSKIINSGKTFCLLWGHDKPRLFHENGRYSIRFIDLIDSGPKVRAMLGEQDFAEELFYWTPDAPKIIIKQAHLLKNYLDSNLHQSPFVSEKKSDLAYKTVGNKKMWLNKDGVHTIIYPRWDITTFCAGKSDSIIYSPRDDWFWAASDTNAEVANWKMGIDKLWTTIPDYWKNDPASAKSGLRGCWSKDYYLN